MLLVFWINFCAGCNTLYTVYTVPGTLTSGVVYIVLNPRVLNLARLKKFKSFDLKDFSPRGLISELQYIGLQHFYFYFLLHFVYR